VGLLRSLLLRRRGIESIIIEARGREAIMQELNVADRLRREGVVHKGVILRFGGRNHRIDLEGLTGGRVATLYPQHEVLKDLIAVAIIGRRRARKTA
jgi:p-hydroxybenzoate 3-monooxygenase